VVFVFVIYMYTSGQWCSWMFVRKTQDLTMFTYEADPTQSRPDDKPFGAARSRSSSSLPSALAVRTESVRTEPRRSPRGWTATRALAGPIGGLAADVRRHDCTRQPARPATARGNAHGAVQPLLRQPFALLHSPHSLLAKTPAPQPGRVRTRTTSPRFVRSACVLFRWKIQHDVASFAAVSEDAVITGWSRFLHRSRACTRPVPPAVVLVHSGARGTVTAKPTPGRFLVGSASYTYYVL